MLDVAGDAGTAFDGEHLFQIAEAEIRKIDPASGEVLGTIPAPGNGGDSGLAWAEGSLWVGQHRDRRIHQVDPETGAVLRTIEFDRFVTGVTWVEGELWHGTWEGETSDVRRIDPETGEVLERLEMPAGTGVSGLESDGGNRFFCGAAAVERCGLSGGRERSPPQQGRAVRSKVLNGRDSLIVPASAALMPSAHPLLLPPTACGNAAACRIWPSTKSGRGRPCRGRTRNASAGAAASGLKPTAMRHPPSPPRARAPANGPAEAVPRPSGP